MQVDEILFSTGDYRARRLWPADLPLVWTFNQECSDFFMLQNGTRQEAKVKGSTELAEVLDPARSFGRDALRRVLARNEPVVIRRDQL